MIDALLQLGLALLCLFYLLRSEYWKQRAIDTEEREHETLSMLHDRVSEITQTINHR